ncbi:MAG: hypothetical protein A4E71_02021 [Smithella sp. PtaU1.Bin162]|nr:MAG: hypothetical protein A4E71_02021 [Smithella sp. PtaU1.Bin162]
MDIHMIEPLNHFVKLQDNMWESGWWSIDESKAKELVGGEIYFHKKQQEPSFFGGSITGYRIEQAEQYQGKIVFTLQYNAACRNVKTDKHGWSKKMKIIGHD